MWYVIWTTTGTERKLCSLIGDTVPNSLYDVVFVPMIEQNKKIKGIWMSFKKSLFPGYIFVKTDEKRIEIFAEYLNHIEQFAVVLSTDGVFTPVSDDETYLIENAFYNNGTLGISVGEITGDKVIILSGPLKGKEGLIKYIDRHKKTAAIELNMFGRISRVILGLEIISKTDN